MQLVAPSDAKSCAKYQVSRERLARVNLCILNPECFSEGYDSDIIECTLSGLVGPFSRHRMARETFISAGGITTYLRLLQRLQFRDLSEPLFTHTLDSLLGLLTDGQAIRESEKVGMITALTTLIQEYVYIGPMINDVLTCF